MKYSAGRFFKISRLFSVLPCVKALVCLMGLLLCLVSWGKPTFCKQAFAGHAYFVQTNVRYPMSVFRVHHPVVSARVLRFHSKPVWRTFSLQSMPRAFLDWNVKARLQMLQAISHGHFPHSGISVAHHGVVATVGTSHDHASFSLNNAVKGFGFLPRKGQLSHVISLLQKTMHAPMKTKSDVLEKLYRHFHQNFDATKLVSLELYTGPKHCTQTFVNQFYNPISSVMFLSIPNYEFKTVVELWDPQNLHLTHYERNIVTYVNLIHRYFHHDQKQYITVVYNVVAVYNNTPDSLTGEGRKL